MLLRTVSMQRYFPTFLTLLLLLCCSLLLSAQNGTPVAAFNYGNARMVGKNSMMGVFGNLGNNASFERNSGTLYFAGLNGKQIISGVQQMDFENIVLQNAKGVNLETTLSVTSSMLFVEGLVRTPRTSSASVALHFAENTVYSNQANQRHVDGYVSKSGAEAFLFPVGDGQLLRMVGISAHNNTLFKAAYFYQNPTQVGYDTAKRANILRKVQGIEFWDIRGNEGINITLTYNLRSQMRLFTENDLNRLVIVGFDGQTWQNLGKIAQTGDMSDGSVTSELVINPNQYQAFTFGILPAEACVNLNIVALLEGATDSVSGLMSTRLNQRGLLPAQTPIGNFAVPTSAGQPYNRPPWNYPGTENTSTYGNDVVDWVLISIRSDTTASSTIWRGAGLIRRSGQITFVTPTCVKVEPTNAYYVVVEHRNHMGVMSPQKVVVSNNAIQYDFTVANSYVAYEQGVPTTIGQKQKAGRFVMLAADNTKNPDVENFNINQKDLEAWRSENGKFDQYLDADLNLDADVNFQDATLWRLNIGAKGKK